MHIPLSERMHLIKPSPTLVIAAYAGKLKKEGKDIVALGVGEPDFDTPQFIKEAAISAILEGYTKYTPTEGMPELKNAIIEKLKRDNHLDYKPSQVMASTGGKQCIFNLAQVLLNPQDEVIIPTPYWVSYPDIVHLAGALPVYIKTNITESYKITPTQLDAAMTEKTRLIFINSPSNPSGKAYTPNELKALAEVLEKHPNIIIATDDMYEKILWGQNTFTNILNVCPALYERTVIINAVSKTYAMTGWRLGYAAGPDALIQAMIDLQSHSTSHPTSISQKAAIAALQGDQSVVHEHKDIFQKRHQYVYERLTHMRGIQVIPADGTFYIFPDVSSIIRAKGFANDLEFATQLLEQTGVALVPGSAFGCEGSIRISFATSDENLKKALDRIEAFIS